MNLDLRFFGKIWVANLKFGNKIKAANSNIISENTYPGVLN